MQGVRCIGRGFPRFWLLPRKGSGLLTVGGGLTLHREELLCDLPPRLVREEGEVLEDERRSMSKFRMVGIQDVFEEQRVIVLEIAHPDAPESVPLLSGDPRDQVPRRRCLSRCQRGRPYPKHILVYSAWQGSCAGAAAGVTFPNLRNERAGALLVKPPPAKTQKTTKVMISDSKHKQCELDRALIKFPDSRKRWWCVTGIVTRGNHTSRLHPLSRHPRIEGPFGEDTCPQSNLETNRPPPL